MNNNRLRNGIQQFMGAIGGAGCYALCLVDVAMEFAAENGSPCYPDIIANLYAGCDLGFIYFNKDDPVDDGNMYVKDPAAFLSLLTGKAWQVRKEYDLSYVPKAGEYVIKRYERTATGRTIGHFERDEFHPIRNSLTVMQGKPVSLRICKVL